MGVTLKPANILFIIKISIFSTIRSVPDITTQIIAMISIFGFVLFRITITDGSTDGSI
jgi:hypothetical protein